MERKKAMYMGDALKELNSVEIGRRIRTQREAIHMTRDNLAEALGVTPKFVADIEYGDKGMSLQTLYKLMQVLNMSADFILQGDTNFSGEEGQTIRQIKENIMAPLSVCKEEELRCMEQITKYYVEALKHK